jgi:hypothetical protein
MDKLIKFVNHPFFGTVLGDRGLRVYKTEVDGRLGMPGLSKLALKATGSSLKYDEAYCFLVKNQNTVKILIRNPGANGLIEVHDEDAIGIKKDFREMTLI